MASIHLEGILVDSLGDIDVGGVLSFTHLTTTGETIATTQYDLVVPPDGVYSIDVEYGQIRIDYTTRYTERFVGIVIVNSDSTATSIPELLNAAVPVTEPVILEMQTILADAVTAEAGAVAAADSIPWHSFDTVALMSASAVVFQDGASIYTRGYNSIDDGGGATYYASSTAIADGVANHTLAGGGVAELSYNVGDINLKQYGAVIGTDITSICNYILGSDKDYGDYTELTLSTRGEYYHILGEVYVRKGQHFIGDGSWIYMAGSGSVKCGFSGAGVADPGGHPITIADFWMEGGNKPINCSVSGYTVRDIFSSFASVGMVLGGSDAHVSNITCDNGSRMMTVSASGSTFTNCIFYIGNEQLYLGAPIYDTVFTNCYFAYAKVAAIRMDNSTGDTKRYRNIRFNNCAFIKNVQNANPLEPVFLGFVVTTNPLHDGDITFSDCSFRNGYKAAIAIYSSSPTLEFNFVNCIFDGLRTRDEPSSSYIQSTTMYALTIDGSGNNPVNMDGCTFKNLHDTPIQLAGLETYNCKLTNCTFENNAGATSISVIGTNPSSSLTVANIQGDNKQLFTIPVTGKLNTYGYLRDWFTIQNNGVRDYIEIPYYAATMFNLIARVNMNLGGSAAYRTIFDYSASLTYDYDTVAVTQGTLQSNFKSTSTFFSSPDITLDIDTVGGGIQVAGTNASGMMVISWPEDYAFESLEAEYKIIG